MAWGKAGSDTLATSGDDLDITSMTATKFNQFLTHIPASGNMAPDLTFNNNSNTVYASRKSTNGGTDVTQTSKAFHEFNTSLGVWSSSEFYVNNTISISAEEKLSIIHLATGGTAGASNAPERVEFVGKFVPSPDADITRIDNNNVGSGSFDTSSNLSALGSDITPAAAIPFAENVQVGSRAEITDTRKIYHSVASTPTFEDDFSTDKSWTEVGTQLTIDTTTNFRIDYVMKRDGADHYADKDMQDADCLNGVNLSDEAFVVRGHMTNTASTGTSYSADGYFAVRSASAPDSTAQDYLAFEFSWGTGAGIRAIAGDGIAIDSATNYTSYFATPITATMDVYLQISRSGNTATFGIYSDSAYTTLVEELSLTIASTYTGLRYLSLVTRNSSSQSSTMTGYLDDIEIHNGVTTVTTGNVWTEEGT
tara:strand:+ start:37 stop:1305 length:1269 start_codon:yes stop_codon:yes gene_type:complete